MNNKRQFSLAFFFLQIAWIALALGSIRPFVNRILRTDRFPIDPPLAGGRIALVVIFAGALGAFIGGFFKKTIIGGIIGVISVPILILLLVLLAFLWDWLGFPYYGE